MARLPSESQTRELKPEQELAAHALDRHVSVTAGPGAGKTTVLVERYLQILRTQKASVDNIVAITFTNRAANEMRERVRREIDSLLDLTSGDERQRWLRHKRTLEAAAGNINGRDFMVNFPGLRVDTQQSGPRMHLLAAAVFATYPLWLWLGWAHGRRA